MRSFTRTTSGAELALIGDYVIKVGVGSIGERIHVQGEWLVRHACSTVPRVELLWDHGVMMERLQPVHDPGSKLVVTNVLLQLQEAVWTQEPEHELDLEAHHAFVMERCQLAAPETAVPLTRWLESTLVRWSADLRRGLTHGDPTLDNTMRRECWEGVVLIDPNPSRPAVPDLIVCDLANVMQSLHGYEHVKYGAPTPEVGPEFVRKLLALEPEEWACAEYLCAAKFARLLAYETTLRPVFREMLHELLQEGGYE